MPKSACSGWCAPAIIMAILSIVSVALAFFHPDAETMQDRLISVGAHAINGAIWTGLLYWLCSICREGLATFLLILPLIVALIVMLALSGVLIALLKDKSKPVEKMENPTEGDDESVTQENVAAETYERPSALLPPTSTPAPNDDSDTEYWPVGQN